MTKAIHGFDGSCAPQGSAYWNQETFSLGVFEILPKASGMGTKRGKAKVRVRGFCADRDAVFAKAREVVDRLDAGAYTGPKTINLCGKVAR